MVNINCQYKDIRTWCTNVNIKRRFFCIGERHCIETDHNGKKCEFKKPWIKPKGLPPAPPPIPKSLTFADICSDSLHDKHSWELSYMEKTINGLQFKCYRCKCPIKKPGGLLLSPPKGDDVKKYHLCCDCYDFITKIIAEFKDDSCKGNK